MKKVNVLVGDSVIIASKGDQRISVKVVVQLNSNVLAVPIGTPGAETMPNGTIWMEY